MFPQVIAAEAGRVAHMRDTHCAGCVQPLLADFCHANRGAARGCCALPPAVAKRQIARLRIAKLDEKSGQGSMNALAIVETLLDEPDDVRHRLRRFIRIRFERERAS